MTKNRKARRAALAAHVVGARLKRKLMPLRKEWEPEFYHKAFVRGAVVGGKALAARRMLGHEAKCTVKVIF